MLWYLPYLIGMGIGSIGGALSNKKRPLEGALMGAAGGAAGAGLGSIFSGLGAGAAGGAAGSGAGTLGGVAAPALAEGTLGVGAGLGTYTAPALEGLSTLTADTSLLGGMTPEAFAAASSSVAPSGATAFQGLSNLGVSPELMGGISPAFNWANFAKTYGKQLGDIYGKMQGQQQPGDRTVINEGMQPQQPISQIPMRQTSPAVLQMLSDYINRKRILGNFGGGR